MTNGLHRSLILALGLTLGGSVALAESNKTRALSYSDYHWEQYAPAKPDYRREEQALATTAAAGTTTLGSWNFETGFVPDQQGWVGVDLSTAPGIFFHIDDYAMLPAADYAPIRGSKSLWCGTRVNTSDPIVCSYEEAPGYGNNWDQTWTTKACLVVTGPLNVAFIAQWSSHYTYCGWSIEYQDCGTPGIYWQRLEGGVAILTDLAPNLPIDFDSLIARAYVGVPTGGAGVKVRLRYQSAHAYSDEDGAYPTNGALHVDSLKVEGLPVEDFEGETAGATETADWIAGRVPGMGNYFDLFPGLAMAQDDPCRRDASYVWAAISGSTKTYACGGKPGQNVVPIGNADGVYIHNEIWSPPIDLAGTSGAIVNLEASVYLDNPLDNLVFAIWRVRQFDGGMESCPRAWRDLDLVYFSDGKVWGRWIHRLGPLLDLGVATHIQVSLGVLDNCRAWCGLANTGCHSHAPMFDTVRVYRVGGAGPEWSIRDLEQFQDNFAETMGPKAGFVRADAANSIRGLTAPGIDPGDSSIVFSVTDPEFGIASDGADGYKVHIYVATWPQGQAGKSGAAVTQDAASHPGASYPWVGSQTIDGITWDIVRCQLTGSPEAGRFRIDLNDCLWEPCDTICFFYCAENNNGVKTYASGSNLGLRTNDIAVAAVNASEFTCLPAGGWKRGGDILYVDGMDGRGAQPSWDSAFQALGILDRVDRYDVRGPSSSVGNRPSTRVKNVSQLLNCYKKIVWDAGDLTVGIGQGKNVGGQPAEKSPDCNMLNLFLGGLTSPGGLYLCGDDQPDGLNRYTEPQAVTFKSTYIPYTLSNPSGGNHVAKGFGISPLITGVAGGCFEGDSFYAHGGCLVINDFDVITPAGGSVMEATYGAPGANNGAIISKRTVNGNAVDVGVMLSAFSFIYVRDDENDGVLDRARHLHDILLWIGGLYQLTTGANTVGANSLSQNYPNPFNPQTTIAFSVKERGLVNLKVYNVAGQLVRTLANEEFAVGSHKKVWDGRDDAGQAIASGVYFYKLVATNFSQTKKMVLLK